MPGNIFNFRSLAILLLIVFVGASVYLQRWNQSIVRGGDQWGYYGYLPAIFIYHDLDDISDSYMARFEYHDVQPLLPGPGGELPIAENGHRIIKYTCGVAILQLPFFLVGHVWATVSSAYPTDGFSFPYIFSVLLGNLVYLFLGLYALFRLLTAIANEKMAFWVLLVAVLGTHLFNYTVYRGAMSHSYLFSLYGGLMYATYRFYEQPGRKWIILAAACAGMITLIRPVEILCLAIPLTYGLVSWEAVRDRVKLWSKHWSWLLLAAGIFILCGIPQLLYWKYASGHWLFDGYPNEGFNFADPEIVAGLFSTQNGWLRYSPIMVLSLLGCVGLLWRRKWLWPVLLIVPLHIYIAYSWWNWYYINGLGSRPMAEMHALLAVPLLYSFIYLNRWRVSRYLLVVLTAGAIGLQLFQNWQNSQGILFSEMANPAYYRSVLWNTDRTYDAMVAFDTKVLQPDSLDLQLQQRLTQVDFEQADSTSDFVSEPVYNGSQALRVTPQKKYGEFLSGTISDLGLSAEQWLRVEAWCYKERKEFPWYQAAALVVELSREGEIIHYYRLSIDNKLHNPEYSLWAGKAGYWGWVRQWVPIPEAVQPSDYLKVYVMAEQELLYVDDVSIESWE